MINKTLVFLTLTLLTVLTGVASYTAVGHDESVGYGILTFFMFMCTTNYGFMKSK